MRRRAAPLLLFLVMSGVTAVPVSAPAQAQGRPPYREQRPVVSGPSGPPHAWLFGVWTGGLFPVLDGMLDQDCKTQPTVIVTRDVMGHASLLGAAMSRRVIETVRTSPAGAEFRFTPDPADPSAFGCEDANVLHVARTNDMQITFPRCAAFPYPLQRCPTPSPAR